MKMHLCLPQQWDTHAPTRAFCTAFGAGTSSPLELGKQDPTYLTSPNAVSLSRADSTWREACVILSREVEVRTTFKAELRADL